MKMKVPILAMFVAAALYGQPLKMPVNVDVLSRLASETVDVTMDASMLRFVEKFLSDKDYDQAKAKRLLRGLNGIVVKTFEFDRAGAYAMSDLDAIREQLRGPGWSRLIQAREDGENVEVYARMQGGEVTGLLVLAAEERELAIVHIDGPIKPEDLASLSGRAGLPKMRIGGLR